MSESVDWGQRAREGFLASGIDPADRRGQKNYYIDLLHKMALDEVLELKGDEAVLDFGCGSGRIAYWIAPKVRKVTGLEVTREMINLAERHRTASNVEFILYDGAHFPDLPFQFDLILSVGVLQTMREESLKTTIFQLVQYLKPEGKLCFIEQASDNPNVGRRSVRKYLQVFKESELECLQHYALRRGRWWMLYLIRYGMIPRKWLPRIACYELEKRRGEKEFIHFYEDFLFVLRKE